MKIAFRLSSLAYGGTERVFLSVADFLSQHGHEISFIIDQAVANPTEIVAQKKGYEIIDLQAARTSHSILPLYKYLVRQRPQIVISAYTEINGATLLSNLMTGLRTPVIVTEHAALDEHWAKRPFKNKLALELIVRVLYRLASQVLCVSAGVAEGVRRRVGGVPVSHIYNPVRFKERRHDKLEARRLANIPPASKVILAVGRISVQKNYKMLVKALAQSKIQDTHLYIVGGVHEVSEKQALESLIEKLNLRHRIHFVDFTDDIGIYYEAADLLVLSSSWEGFGNVLVEALSFGLPIVSTRCNHGPSEILAEGRYGRLVDVNDHAAMASAIDDIVGENPFSVADQMNRAVDFSEENIGRQYLELIQRKLRASS